MAPAIPVLVPGKRALRLAHAGLAEHVCVHLLPSPRGTALMAVHLVMAFLPAIQALIVPAARFAPWGVAVGSMSAWVPRFVEVAVEET
jgi:hypothetical protein